MNKLLLTAAFLLTLQGAAAQVFEERGIEAPSRWVDSKGNVFVQDSIYSYGSNGKVSAKEFNLFNEKGFETGSHTVSVKWDGSEAFGNRDEFVYDDNGNEVKYSLYSWNGTEWTLSRVNESFYSDNRLDSVYVNMYDKDLDEMFVKGIEKSEYGENGELLSFARYTRAGVYDDLLPDMRFEYKDFNSYHCPAAAESFVADGNGGLRKYMDIAFTYDNEGRLESYDYTAPDGDGKSTNIKKVELAYNKEGRLESKIEYGRDAEGDYVASRRTVYEYDSENGYPVKQQAASYTAANDTWRDGNRLEYFWRKFAEGGVAEMAEDADSALVFDGRTVIAFGASIRVFDMQGRLVLRGDSTLDASGLHSGMYVVNADNGRRQSTVKIVVE